MRPEKTCTAKVVAVLLVVPISTVVAWAALTAWSVNKVKGSAETLTNGAPYCLQISGEWDYKEVRRLLDLSIFKMRASSSLHHAVLVVERPDGTELLHWSYKRQTFVSGALGPPGIYCTPRPHDLLTLDVAAMRQKPAFSHIRIRRMAFSIPRRFLPIVSSNSNGIRFFAKSPHFGETKAEFVQGGIGVEGDINDHVEIRFGETGFHNTSLHRNDSSHRVEAAGTEHGLSKQLVWYLPSQKSHSYRPSVDYYIRAADGKIDTIISCDSIPAGTCLHSFYDKQWTYTFHHSKAFLADWKIMQVRLSKLVASFRDTEPMILDTRGLFENHLAFKLDRPTLSVRRTPDAVVDR